MRLWCHVFARGCYHLLAVCATIRVEPVSVLYVRDFEVRAANNTTSAILEARHGVLPWFPKDPLRIKQFGMRHQGLDGVDGTRTGKWTGNIVDGGKFPVLENVATENRMVPQQRL